MYIKETTKNCICRITDYATSYATLLLHSEREKSHFDNELSELLAIEEKYIIEGC
jgi:hypothetical protein